MINRNTEQECPKCQECQDTIKHITCYDKSNAGPYTWDSCFKSEKYSLRCYTIKGNNEKYLVECPVRGTN